MATHLCALALQHDIEPDYTKNLIRIYKLKLPRNAEPVEQWPYPLKLYTLGRFSVLRDGAPLRSGGKTQKKPLELLKALIAAGGREVSAAKIMEWLWPQSEGDAASQAYHVTLKRLRELIGDNALVQEGGRLTLDPDVCWVDEWAFERALGQAGDDLDKLRAAVTLYRGNLFADDDAPHLLSARERLKARYLKAVTTLGRQLEGLARHDEAQQLYESALKIDDLIENFYQGLMRTHAALHQPDQVRTTYERLCKLLKARLGVTPSAATEQLKQALLPA
jgi:two-component SAPR family response regulator